MKKIERNLSLLLIIALLIITTCSYTPVFADDVSYMYYENSFDAAMSGITLTNTPAKGEISIKSEGRNRYLDFTTVDANAGDFRANVFVEERFKAHAAESIVLEFDAKIDSDNTANIQLLYYTTAHKNNVLAYLGGSSNDYRESSTSNRMSTLSSGRWKKIAMVINLKDGSIVHYVDGIQKRTTHVTNANGTVRYFSFRAFDCSAGSKIMFDNIKVYEGTAPNASAGIIIDSPSSVVYERHKVIEGNAYGTITITPPPVTTGLYGCEAYWGDANGVVLDSTAKIGKVAYTGAETETLNISDGTVIPDGAEKIVVFSKSGNFYSAPKTVNIEGDVRLPVVVDGDKIHGFIGMTVSDLKENSLLPAPLEITVYESDGETLVSDSTLTQTGMILKIADHKGVQEYCYTFDIPHYYSNGVRVLVNGYANTDVFTTGDIEVSADVINYSDIPVNLAIFIARYSCENDELLELKIINESVGKGTANETVKMSISDYAGTYIKIFSMDIETMEFLGEVKKLQPLSNIGEIESVKYSYPGFLQKAVTFSYDDLRIDCDPMLMSIFSKYGIKATFNLVTNKLTGPQKHIEVEPARSMYEGFDTISHSYSHPLMYLTSPKEESNGNTIQPMTLDEVTSDIKRGQEDMTLLCGKEPIGFVWPFTDPRGRSDYQDILDFIRNQTNIKYIRPTGGTGTFAYPEDWYSWKATCHHNSIPEHLPQFLNADPGDDLLLFSIWGHSYEFNYDENTVSNKLNWDDIDRYAKILGEDDTIWKADNTEIYNYKTAVDNIWVDYNDDTIINESDVDIYLIVNGYKIVMPAHSAYSLKP